MALAPAISASKTRVNALMSRDRFKTKPCLERPRVDSELRASSTRYAREKSYFCGPKNFGSGGFCPFMVGIR
jgi:hypothetical protein